MTYKKRHTTLVDGRRLPPPSIAAPLRLLSFSGPNSDQMKALKNILLIVYLLLLHSDAIQKLQLGGNTFIANDKVVVQLFIFRLR